MPPESIISLIMLNKNSAIMARNGSAMACPFRQPEYITTGEKTIRGEDKIRRQETKCGTWCPHFNVQSIPDDETKKSELHVLLTCGTSDTIHQVHQVIEPKSIQN